MYPTELLNEQTSFQTIQVFGKKLHFTRKLNLSKYDLSKM